MREPSEGKGIYCLHICLALFVHIGLWFPDCKMTYGLCFHAEMANFKDILKRIIYHLKASVIGNKQRQGHERSKEIMSHAEWLCTMNRPADLSSPRNSLLLLFFQSAFFSSPDQYSATLSKLTQILPSTCSLKLLFFNTPVPIRGGKYAITPS